MNASGPVDNQERNCVEMRLHATGRMLAVNVPSNTANQACGNKQNAGEVVGLGRIGREVLVKWALAMR